MYVSTNNSDISILVIDDDAATRNCVVAILAQEAYRVYAAPTAAEGLELLHRTPADLVITDLRIGHESGLDIVKSIHSLYPDTEAILMTAIAANETAGEAIHPGAFDYILKPFLNQHLLLKVQKALERKMMKQEINRLRQHVAMSYGFDNIVGISRQIQQLKDTAMRVAPTDITVLITGPSGTGKELFARAIHHHSNRRTGRFVAVDCSSIPEALLESELFGHSQGSFTSSTATRKGLFEEADGGTLFLDEVSNMPMSVQAHLLRFLQDSEIRPVGASESRKVNVRIVAATNLDLKDLADAGAFRRDLYFRLNVIPITLPALIDRAEDIEMLTDYFLRKISHETKGHPMSISRQAVDKLLGHHWPGNVRELENTLKRGAALCTGNQIEASDIMFISGEKVAPAPLATPGKVTLTVRGGRLDSEQRTLILKTLSENSWNFTRTAQELGIGRTTLWRKIKKYNLAKEAGLVEAEM